MNSSKRRGGSSTVRRAIALLKLLGEHPDGIGLSRLAALADLHHATAHRLLRTLVDGKLAVLGDDKRYRLGFGVLDLAGVLLSTLEIRDVARAQLEWLADNSGETAHLATLDGDEAVFLDRVDGPQPITLRTRVGFRAACHATAVGKVLLAHLPAEELALRRKSRMLRRCTQKTITDWAALSARLDLIRQQGYATDDEEHRLDVRCIAAPIFDRNNRPIAAVSIAGPTFRVTPERVPKIARTVKSVAQAISRAMGHARGATGLSRPLPKSRKERLFA